jgi:hypothetical protein
MNDNIMTPTRMRVPGAMIDSGLVGFTDFHSLGRGTARAEDAQGTPTQSHTSPSKMVYEDKPQNQKPHTPTDRGDRAGGLAALTPEP